MMYNHYIPQSDGSYRRSSAADQRRNQPQSHKMPPPKPEPECPPEPPKPKDPPSCPQEKPQGSILDFLRGLLPREIDTADLLIIFLLLLMNKDEKDGLSPVLTLALYFLL